jgi:hypothetical protein
MKSLLTRLNEFDSDQKGLAVFIAAVIVALIASLF